jgi:hypothetical protein
LAEEQPRATFEESLPNPVDNEFTTESFNTQSTTQTSNFIPVAPYEYPDPSTEEEEEIEELDTATAYREMDRKEQEKAYGFRLTMIS